MSERCPDQFVDLGNLGGREWKILPYRFPTINPHVYKRTIVEAQGAGQDYPDSHMVTERYILDTIREQAKERGKNGETRS